MSLKENINAIKEEISAEEQFLESVIKAEGFLKKYRPLLIAIATLLIVGALGYITYDWIKTRDLRISNEAFLKLQQHPEDKSAIETLKEKNPPLYQAWLFQNGLKSSDPVALSKLMNRISDPALKDLLSYQIASLKRDGIDQYAMKQDAILKEFALLQAAYLLLEKGNIEAARAKLAQISPTSPLQRLAQSLDHLIKLK